MKQMGIKKVRRFPIGTLARAWCDIIVAWWWGPRKIELWKVLLKINSEKIEFVWKFE
jgi:hypothetical protein